MFSEDFHSSGMLAVGDQLQIDQDFHSSGVDECGGEFIRAPKMHESTGNLHCDGSVIAQTVIMRELGFLILDIQKSWGMFMRQTVLICDGR